MKTLIITAATLSIATPAAADPQAMIAHFTEVRATYVACLSSTIGASGTRNISLDDALREAAAICRPQESAFVDAVAAMPYPSSIEARILSRARQQGEDAGIRARAAAMDGK